MEQREFAKGDRIEFRQPDRDLGVVNGALAHVVAIDVARQQARLHLDGRERLVTIDLSRAHALDHGYASTSYRSQGRTVDHVIVLQDARLATREGFYVGTSRGRDSILVVTDDREALLRQVGRDQRAVTHALDLVREAQRQPEWDYPSR